MVAAAVAVTARRPCPTATVGSVRICAAPIVTAETAEMMVAAAVAASAPRGRIPFAMATDCAIASEPVTA